MKHYFGAGQPGSTGRTLPYASMFLTHTQTNGPLSLRELDDASYLLINTMPFACSSQTTAINAAEALASDQTQHA
eukprot:3613181-Amphidinium_carterae.1